MSFAGVVTALSQPARQALPIIRGGVRRGIGADALYRSLRSRFPGLLRREVREIGRAERLLLSRSADLRFMRRDFRPDPSRLAPSVTALRRQYSFQVRVRGFQVETGEAVEDWITVSTDELLTREEIEDVAQGYLESAPERYQVESYETLLVAGARAGPEGVLG